MFRIWFCVLILLTTSAWLAVEPACGQEAAVDDTLVVAQDHAWPPFSWLDDQGKPRGLLIELWREIAQAGGREVRFELVDWPETLELVRRGEADVHGGLFASPERAQFLMFSDQLLPLSAALFIASNQRIISVEELGDTAVGVVEGSFELEFVKTELPELRLRHYPNNRLMVSAALEGEVNAFVGDYPVAMYLMDQLGATARFHPLEVLYTRDLVAGMQQGDVQTAEWLRASLAAVGEERVRGIVQRWMRAEQVEVLPLRWVLSVIAAAAFLVLLVATGLLLRQRRWLNDRIQRRTQELSLAQQEARRSYDFLSRVTSSLPGVIFSYRLEADGGHCFPYISQRVVELMGVTPEQLAESAEPLFDRVHPQDREHGQGSILASARDHSNWNFAFRLRLQSGEYRWFEAQSTPERLADGSVLWCGHFIDIHHQRELEQAMLQRTRFNKLLANASSQLLAFGSGELEPRVNHLLASLGKFLEVDRCYLILSEAQHGQDARLFCWCANGVSALTDQHPVLASDPSAWWRQQCDALRSGAAPMMIGQLAKLPEHAQCERQRLAEHRVEALAIVAVRAQKAAHGWVGVDSGQARRWSPDVAEQLQLVANLLVEMLEKDRLETELIEKSVTDPLTGLYNRRYLFERLEERLAENRRNGASVALALLDIDHFKPLNDTHGHAAGDQALKQVAALVRRQVRPFDVVCRFGGEEFLLLFVGSDLQQACLITERILADLRQHTFQYGELSMQLTASAGVAALNDLDADERKAQTLIECADNRLYRAKRAGRDRLVASA